MSWTAFTATHVAEEFSPQEIATINASAGAANLPGIVARVVAAVRDAIMAGGYATDADTTTIPSGLHIHALDMARWRFLVAFPALKSLQTPDRKDANDRALAELAKISNQERAVEPPASLTVVSRAGAWNSENPLVPRTHPVPRASTQYTPGSTDYANDGTTPAPVLSDLPTTDPGIRGKLWNNGGVVMISAGS